MTRRSAAPFHQLPETCVAASPWIYELDGMARGKVDSLLPDWDYSSALSFERSVGVAWAEAVEALGFQGRFDVELVVEIGSGRGNPWREVLHTERIPFPYETEATLVRLNVPSRLMSHQVSLRTSLLLLTAASTRDRLSPVETGSRLWQDRVSSRLEGDDPRFPMEVVNFDAHFPGRFHRHAAWFVNWSPAGAQRDFRGAIRLYLNSAKPTVLERVKAQDPLVLQAIMSDVVSQVCEGLLREVDHAGELDDAEEGSLAEQARHWLERAFGGVDEARAVLEQRPGEFRAAILASVRLEG